LKANVQHTTAKPIENNVDVVNEINQGTANTKVSSLSPVLSA